jgi:hypothetical protein
MVTTEAIQLPSSSLKVKLQSVVVLSQPAMLGRAGEDQDSAVPAAKAPVLAEGKQRDIEVLTTLRTARRQPTATWLLVVALGPTKTKTS